MKLWYLYLIRCGDGSIYTGVSTDVARRLSEHHSGKGARYLRGRGPLLLARKIRVGGKSAAFKLEWQVKRMPRKDKEKLIAGKIKLKDLLKPLFETKKKNKHQVPSTKSQTSTKHQ